MSHPFINTEKGLEAYDLEIKEVVDPLWEKFYQASADEAPARLRDYERAESEAKTRLARAVHEDTRAYNSFENCCLVHVDTLREWVHSYTKKAGK